MELAQFVDTELSQHQAKGMNYKVIQNPKEIEVILRLFTLVSTMRKQSLNIRHMLWNKGAAKENLFILYSSPRPKPRVDYKPYP